MLTAVGSIRREHVAQLDAALLADPPRGVLPVLADDALLAAPPRYGDLTQLADENVGDAYRLRGNRGR
jgi:hypothetical protein